MRATRAYLAGFGTSGSLLAGAALMFLLASAFVAFQGWPQVDGQSSPVLVSVPQVNTAGATRASRALSATTANPTRRTTAGAGSASATHAGATHPTSVRHGSTQTAVPPVTGDPGTSSGPIPGTVHHSTGPVPSTRPCTLNCGPVSGGPGSPVTKVQKAVSGASKTAKSTVGNTVTTVKKILPGSTGSGNGGTVGGVVKTVTNVVKGATGGLP